MNDQSSSRPTEQQPDLATEVIDAAPIDGFASDDLAEPAPEQPISWQASEYIHHHKGAMWYVALVAVVLVLVGVAFFFKSWFSIGVFVAMGATIAVYAHKPPRTLAYSLDADAVTIEAKSYPYSNFHSFAVVSEPEWHSIDLEPSKRFMPRLTVLFKDEDFDTIIDHLSLHLPRTDRQPDLVERVTRYLRF